MCQSYLNREIIVVDDGSTDDTLIALNKYRGDIKYIYQNNKGVSAARNTGIRSASGKWVAFLDSDDEWHSDYLSYQINQIRNNPGACVYITNATYDEGDNKVDFFQKWNMSQLFKKDDILFLQRPLYHVIKFHIATVITATINKNKLVAAGLFNESFTIAEDYDLMTRLAILGPFVLGKERKVDIIRRSENIDNLEMQLETDRIKTRKTFEYIYSNILFNYQLSEDEKAIISKEYSENQRALANLILNTEREKDARIYYKEAFLIYPSIKSIAKYFISLLPINIARLVTRLLRIKTEYYYKRTKKHRETLQNK